MQVAFGGNGDDGEGYWSSSIREVRGEFLRKLDRAYGFAVGSRLRRIHG